MDDQFDILSHFKDFLYEQQWVIRKKYDPNWCSWFVGLVDGEGYFHLVRRHTRFAFEVEFVMNLRIDDKPMLVEIKNTLGIGRIHDINDEAQRKQGHKASDRARFRCYNVEEITRVLIPLFDEYPLHSKKCRDYEIWREAAFLQLTKAYRGDVGYDRMMYLVEKLKRVRADTPLNNRQFVSDTRRLTKKPKS